MNNNKDWDLLEGVTKSKFTTSFQDNRGRYNEIFNLRSDPSYEFKQLSIVHNKKNILRGMHGDWGTTKKVSVISGKVIQVLLDCRIGSNTYGQYKSSLLSEEDEILISIPSGIANGFQVIEKPAIYLYLQNTFYKDFEQFTITPYDKCLSGAFNLSLEPIISLRDSDINKTLNNINCMN